MFIKSLAELGENDLVIAGGKAANLGILINAGFPVPRGFCITTGGYKAFIAAHDLQPKIGSLISCINRDKACLNKVKTGSIKEVSGQLRSLFTERQIPDKLEDEIRKAFMDYGFSYSAVRSSATTEDLPGMSFAGQQDTYLNIKGISSLLDAIRKCWASLWTERAVTYRERNRVLHSEASIAVVVQEMVPAEASGVLFTANPLTGKRTEMVIDAVTGLGEALVSGLVEPDHYVIDTAPFRIIKKVTGKKKLSIHGLENGGTETVKGDMKKKEAIGDAQIRELIQLGRQAVSVFHSPQDMEWAWAGSRIYILQSRPITSLYPLPDHLPGNGLFVLFSFGALQGMLDPFTPLGSDIFRLMAIPLARILGRHVTLKTQRGFIESGMRLFLNFTPLFRSRFGRFFLKFVLPYGEPGSMKAIETLFHDPRLCVTTGFMKIRTFLGFLLFFVTVFINTIINIFFPASARRRVKSFIDHLVSGLSARHASIKSLAKRIRCIEKTIKRIPLYLFSRLIPAVACGQAPLQLLRRLHAHLPDGERIVMQLTHGLPHNVTTEMDLLLWQTACLIKADKNSYDYFKQNDVASLIKSYEQGEFPVAARNALRKFIKTYGIRGVAEIDIGRQRWKENPEFLIRMMKSFLDINDPGQSPAAVFQRGAADAEKAGKQLLKMLEQTKSGKLIIRITAFLTERVRQLAGLRETPKFTVIQALAVQRDALLADGKELLRKGIIEKPEDIFFLRLEDLKKIAGKKKKNRKTPVKSIKEEQDWKVLINRNKENYAREKLRRLIPRILLSDGTSFYGSMDTLQEDNPDIIRGTPVSPGIAEGVVHVIFDPFKEQLSPGEILVCPGTDPAWTPLFLAASGLVMEVGGLMTHGAVVAREYGIPAIVGVDRATSRLNTGQRIRIDGSEGMIKIIR